MHRRMVGSGTSPLKTLPGERLSLRIVASNDHFPSSPTQVPPFAGDGLLCIRSERRVFSGVSFAVGAGDLLVLRGANGSGKSSLLRLMAGLSRPHGGRLTWLGEDVFKDRAAHARRLSYVAHADAVKAALTVAENVGFWARLAGMADVSARVVQALDAFGIRHLADIPGRFLSAGQRRRVGLSRLLVMPAVLWLLDEPATALDVETLARLENILRRHREGGGMVVMSAHGNALASGARVLDLDEAGNRPSAEMPC